MANRCTLHIRHLEEFKEWLRKDGWEIHNISNSIYEVLRATKPGKTHPLIVYQKSNAKEHLSIADRDVAIVGAFYRDRKKPKTNADRIRSMNDYELAEFLIRQHACDNCDYYNGARCKAPDGFKCTNEYAAAIIQKWLQEEAEEQQ